MTERELARAALSCLGGIGNVAANALDGARLRVTVASRPAVDLDALQLLDGVLAVNEHELQTFDVVLEPSLSEAVFDEFSILTGISSSYDPIDALHGHRSNLHVHVSPGRRRSYEAQARANKLRKGADNTTERSPIEAPEVTRPEEAVIEGLDLTKLLEDEEP